MTIHTNRSGEISETVKGKDEEELRKLREQANAIDSPESPFKVIVSVLMLKEGWDGEMDHNRRTSGVFCKVKHFAGADAWSRTS